MTLCQNLKAGKSMSNILYKQGDIVVGVIPGSYGKVRPLVVVQHPNNLTESTIICPLTTYADNSLSFRVPILPSTENGLYEKSTVMVEKITAISNKHIKERIGQLESQCIFNIKYVIREILGL